MSDEELCYLPATELIDKFRNKSLSPVEVMEAVIAQSEKTELVVNAFSHTFFDKAMEQARKAEQKYASGKHTGPLEGLPIAIKDETEVKGQPCTNGSLTMKDYVATHTSVNNQRIMRAGGIIHARTTTPEFSCAGYTHSKLHGITRNPWNPEYTSGGSSGGASASLASGTCSIATGSDIGGSIRIPSATCALSGLKPTFGRNPEEPPFNLDQYCHTGPMARTVKDTILLQNVMCGPHHSDIVSLKPRLRIPFEFKPIKGWKIAWSMDLGKYEVEEDVQKNTLQALDVFRELGATVEEVELDWPDDMFEAGMSYLSHLFGTSMVDALDKHGDQLTDYAAQWAINGPLSTAKDFLHSLEVAGKMYNTFGRIMQKHHLFICPTNNLAAVKADHNQVIDEVIINGKKVDPLLGWVMTLPFNMLSRCPVLTAPTGRTHYGIPTSIQLVARTYQDKDVCRAGLAFENQVGQWFRDSAHRPDSITQPKS
ncbi:MAG: Asp-tRNA(Asn)/Glu-tRNA(Gln) amidotransferase A subunit family amidase [Parasphingorhabdus sp.]|jgi:Asp-tRNA(Asn)/Glu-tRNA(Gln) amidotransferase A subunit family amidase